MSVTAPVNPSRRSAAQANRPYTWWQMKYEIAFKPRAIKDLKALPTDKQRRIIAKIEELGDNLAGDVKS